MILALVVLVVVVAGADLSVYYLNKTQNTLAFAINDAGRQRMLTLNIILESHKLIDEKDPLNLSQYRNHLIKLSKELDKTHESLEELAADYDNSSLIFTEEVHDFVLSGQELANAPIEALTLNNQHYRTIHDSREPLITLFNTETAAWQEAAEKQIEERTQSGLISLAIFFLALSGLTLFIFRPMLRLLEKEMKSSADINETLERRIEDRTRTLEAQSKVLRESELHHKQAMEQADLAFWRWSFDKGRHTYWSDNYEEILFIQANMPLDYDEILRSVHPDDRDRVLQTYLEADKNFSDFDIDYRVTGPDGQIRHIHEHADVEYDEQGKPIAHIGIVHNITEHVKAEEEIKTRDSWLRSIFRNAPIEIILKDTDGRIIAASDNVASILGVDNDDLIGNTLADFMSSQIADSFVASDREVLETGEPVKQELVEEIDGVTRYLLNEKFPLQDDVAR